MSRNRRKNLGSCWRCGHAIRRVRGWGWAHVNDGEWPDCPCAARGGYCEL